MKMHTLTSVTRAYLDFVMFDTTIGPNEGFEEEQVCRSREIFAEQFGHATEDTRQARISSGKKEKRGVSIRLSHVRPRVCNVRI